MFNKLQEYVREVQAVGFVQEIIVDGSFISGVDEPNDIDIILIVRPDHDFGSTLRPFEYNVVSKRRVRKRYAFDEFVARLNSSELNEYMSFFQQVRGHPDHRKGLVKVAI